MDNTIVWIIIAGFYAPLHFIPPALLVLFKADEEMRKTCLKRSLLDSSLSMLLAFGIVYYIGLENMSLAMGVLLVAILLPYIRVIKVVTRTSTID